tara:strand:+ start:3457 stop:4932 length:1476 start_codon:yes stop_codon:yes gene_type:complete
MMARWKCEEKVEALYASADTLKRKRANEGEGEGEGEGECEVQFVIEFNDADTVRKTDGDYFPYFVMMTFCIHSNLNIFLYTNDYIRSMRMLNSIPRVDPDSPNSTHISRHTLQECPVKGDQPSRVRFVLAGEAGGDGGGAFVPPMYEPAVCIVGDIGCCDNSWSLISPGWRNAYPKTGLRGGEDEKNAGCILSAHIDTEITHKLEMLRKEYSPDHKFVFVMESTLNPEPECIKEMAQVEKVVIIYKRHQDTEEIELPPNVEIEREFVSAPAFVKGCDVYCNQLGHGSTMLGIAYEKPQIQIPSVTSAGDKHQYYLILKRYDVMPSVLGVPKKTVHFWKNVKIGSKQLDQTKKIIENEALKRAIRRGVLKAKRGYGKSEQSEEEGECGIMALLLGRGIPSFFRGIGGLNIVEEGSWIEVDGKVYEVCGSDRFTMIYKTKLEDIVQNIDKYKEAARALKAKFVPDLGTSFGETSEFSDGCRRLLEFAQTVCKM